MAEKQGTYNLTDMFTDKLAETKDTLKLDDLIVECNYNKWNEVGSHNLDDVFYFKTASEGASLTTTEVRKLVKYLEEWSYYSDSIKKEELENEDNEF